MEELCYKIFNNFLQVKNTFFANYFKNKKSKSPETFAFFIRSMQNPTTVFQIQTRGNTCV